MPKYFYVIYYSLHADAAWGGYMCSMLTTDKKKKTFIGKAYVASSQLNDYSRYCSKGVLKLRNKLHLVSLNLNLDY